MKKFIRFCGVAILTLLVVGVIFVGIGAYTVGWEELAELTSKVSNGKISLKNGVQIKDLDLFQIDEMLNAKALYNINDSNMFDKSEEVWKDDVEKAKVAKDSVERLKIEIGGCLFEVKESEDDAYYVEYEGKGKSQAYTKGDTLYIKALNASNINFEENKNCLTLYIPRDLELQEVDVELGAGQMKLDNLQVDALNVDLGAGKIEANDLQANEIKVSVGAGDFTLEDAKLDEVKIEVGAGNCKIQGSVSEEVKADCAMGNITLILEGEEEDFDYEVECVSGNLKVGDTEYSGLSKEKSVDNDADKKLDLQCVMGNIEVEFE